MIAMDWRQVIEAWRSLPEEEQIRRLWARIPRNVAESMAFEGEPVSLEDLEAAHAVQTPPGTSKPPSAS